MSIGRTRTLWYVVSVAVALGLAGVAWLFRDSPVFTQAHALLTQWQSKGDSADSGKQAGSPATPPSSDGRRRASGPAAVEVASARASKSTQDIEAIGSLQSDEAIVLAPEVSGRIAAILFDEGKPVKRDAVLVKLDDALVAAEVADAKARLTLADANNDRARTLAKTGVVTGRGRDEALANYETAQAALALAETKLSKLELRAPFDGIVGTRNISVGAFVNAGAPITNLEKVDVLKVDFKVPETELQRIKVGQKIELTVDALPKAAFAGEIYAINPLIDVNGRALQVRARLANKDMMLRPGLFARIRIKGLTERNVVMIPEAAVVPRGEKTFVFKVADGKAVEQSVELGQRSNAEVEILNGLDAAATVVVAGQQKLKNGSALEIVVPSAPAPVPAPATGPQPAAGPERTATDG